MAGTLRSIFDLPLESGGRENRQGLSFQDHVAAGLCLEMVENTEIAEVWCESHDDVTVIWRNKDSLTVEFVQVKSADLESRWSVADLTHSEKTGKKTRKMSLLEQSLVRARCTETVRFRIVTYTDVTKDLSILKSNIGGSDRTPEKLNVLSGKILKKKLQVLQSANGTTVQQWIEKCLWQKRNTTSAEENTNSLLTAQVVKREFGYLITVDQAATLYGELLKLVKQASEADLSVSPESYKIKRDDLRAWLRNITNGIVFHLNLANPSKMEAKMKRSKILDDVIAKASDLRLAYVRERLTTSYAAPSALPTIESRILARLQLERTALETGQFSENGPQFHARCLRVLEQIRESWPEASRPESAVLQGYMYELTNRCCHAFDLEGAIK